MRKFLILGLILAGVWYVGINQGHIEKPNFDFLKSDAPIADVLTKKVEILDEESAVVSAIEKALPSVVTIEISKTTTTPGNIQFDPFRGFQRQPGTQQQLQQNIGSGFAVANNIVVTNKHVVGDAEATYRVITTDNTAYEVKSIARDPLNDLAILSVDTNKLKSIELGDSEKLKLGQRVIAIGTPLGEFPSTVTTGIVSGLGRGITAGSPYEGFVERLDNVIQTDAAINPGNSGGPLINSKGQVIGINTAVSESSQNIGFAIPVNVVKELVENFNASGGKINRPFIGIRYKMIDKNTALLNDVPEGAYIVEVVQNSPADEAGIEVGDIITELDGTRIRGEDDKEIQKLTAKHKINDKVKVKIFRSGKLQDLTLTLDRFE